MRTDIRILLWDAETYNTVTKRNYIQKKTLDVKNVTCVARKKNLNFVVLCGPIRRTTTPHTHKNVE